MNGFSGNSATDTTDIDFFLQLTGVTLLNIRTDLFENISS